MNDRLKIAIQKKGRLNEESLALLRSCGIEIDRPTDRLLVSSTSFPIDILFVRDDDIPAYVVDGVCDLGIVGQNVLREKSSSARFSVLKELGFGKCRLALAVPQGGEICFPVDLNMKKIATSYPKILDEYLDAKGIKAESVFLEGAVEIAPSLNVADAICDLVSTGSTLRANQLREIGTIFESQAVLVASSSSKSTEKSNVIQKLTQRIEGSLRAKQMNYVMLNAPREQVEKIKDLIPGMEEPTVVPLMTGNRVAIHAVAKETVLWDTVEKLKELGGSSILVSPIEKIIL